MRNRPILAALAIMFFVGCDPGPPQWGPAAKLEVKEVTGTSAKLSWALPNAANGLSSIRIKHGEEVLAEVGAGTLSYVAENLKGNTEYTFTVEVSDMKGNWSPPLNATAKTLDALPPTWPDDATLEFDIESRGALGSKVTFAWTHAKDDVGVTQYKVVRDDQTEVEELGLIPADETEFEYQSVDVDGHYKILAQDAAGNWSEDGPAARVWANKGLKLMLQKQGFMAPSSKFRLNSPSLRLTP